MFGPERDIERIERAVLGAILLEGREKLSLVITKLRPDNFTGVRRIIYDAMLRLFGRGEPVDLITLNEELRRSEQLQAVGGPSALARLAEESEHKPADVKTERIVSAAEGRVACEHRKIAVIGNGPTRDLAPWSDDTWCWQALNEIAQDRFDRHWEMHPMRVQSTRELAWLAGCPAPCYVLDLDDAGTRVANAVQYPLARVLAQTGARSYFTCTFAFQIALAIADGFDEIGVWGVDLHLGTLRERLIEKPCVEYWLGIAQGLGIRITLPPSTRLAAAEHLYGYEYDQELAAVQRLCDELPLLVPRKRWPKILQRLGSRYGGKIETAMASAAAELGSIGSAPGLPDDLAGDGEWFFDEGCNSYNRRLTRAVIPPPG